ncbi:MAG: SCP2 sterol-binding domain-containing protein [Deltaproteobacteria bacterium]|nr:SCP2 sterol-binding domain-containing protein [Deltaproteobacteria bacterium]
MEKARIVSRIVDEALSFVDIPAYMTLVCELCNGDEKIRKQTADDRVTFQFLIEGGKDFWLKVDSGKFTCGDGKLDAPEMVIGMDERTCAGVFGNRVNATTAYLNRDMSFQGSLKHGLKFRNIFKSVNKLLGV